MTIEKLIGLSTEDLESLSIEDLDKYFKPILSFTRPKNLKASDFKSRAQAKNTLNKRKNKASKEENSVIDLFKSLGLNPELFASIQPKK